jgi:site-specific recombinase XerD
MAFKRTVPITEKLADIMRDYVQWCYDNHERECGDTFLCRKDGTPMYPSAITQWLNSLAKKYNLNHIEGQNLRQTCIAQLVNYGVPITEVARMAGYTSVPQLKQRLVSMKVRGAK